MSEIERLQCILNKGELEDDPEAMEAIRFLYQKGYTVDEVCEALDTMNIVASVREEENEEEYLDL